MSRRRRWRAAEAVMAMPCALGAIGPEPRAAAVPPTAVPAGRAPGSPQRISRRVFGLLGSVLMHGTALAVLLTASVRALQDVPHVREPPGVPLLFTAPAPAEPASITPPMAAAPTPAPPMLPPPAEAPPPEPAPPPPQTKAPPPEAAPPPPVAASPPPQVPPPAAAEPTPQALVASAPLPTSPPSPSPPKASAPPKQPLPLPPPPLPKLAEAPPRHVQPARRPERRHEHREARRVPPPRPHPAEPSSPRVATAAAEPRPAAAAPHPAAALPVAPPSLPGGMAEHCPPPYPRAALRDRIEGRVVIRVHVSADGRPSAPVVVRSSGSPLLDRAALAAIDTCHFVPATQGGRPIPFVYEVPYRFMLSN